MSTETRQTHAEVIAIAYAPGPHFAGDRSWIARIYRSGAAHEAVSARHGRMNPVHQEIAYQDRCRAGGVTAFRRWDEHRMAHVEPRHEKNVSHAIVGWWSA